MSKKKKKKDYGIFSEKICKEIAQQLEDFLDATNLIIIENKSYKDVEKASEKVRKMIKNLREGKPEKVLNEEAYLDYVNSLPDMGD